MTVGKADFLSTTHARASVPHDDSARAPAPAHPREVIPLRDVWIQQGIISDKSKRAQNSTSKHDESFGDTFYNMIRDHAGNASSILSMLGAAAIFTKGNTMPMGKQIVWASLIAGGIDTAIQGWQWLHGNENGSDLGTTLYAATGLLPAASLYWLKGMHITSPSNLYHLAAIGANTALIGYEAVHRGGRIMEGDETVGGYLAVGAALSGVFLPLRHI